MERTPIGALTLVAGLLAAAPAMAAEPSGSPQAMVEQGKKLFETKRCAVCHTVGGTGQEDKRDLDQYSMFADPLLFGAVMWNHASLMDKSLAGFLPWPEFAPGELAALVAYIHQASGGDQHQYVASANVTEGRKTFETHCQACHALGGMGGKVGPDLVERLRAVQSRADVAGMMWNHVPEMSKAMQARNMTVPKLDGRQMADLFAFLLQMVSDQAVQDALAPPPATPQPATTQPAEPGR